MSDAPGDPREPIQATDGRFLDLEFPAEVWLASETVPLQRLLELEPGGILKLARDPDHPVDLVVNGSVVATGELVVIDSRFGFRVTGTVGKKLSELDPAANNNAPPEAAEPRPPAPDPPAEPATES